MTSHLSARSVANLKGVHPKLVAVVVRAHEICLETAGPDFTVIEGVRSKKRQLELYAQGRTDRTKPIVTWTKISRHQKNQKTGFGHAVDLFPGDWNDLPGFEHIANAMFEAARELKVNIRYGGDWDRDGNRREQGETDSPHFEI